MTDDEGKMTHQREYCLMYDKLTIKWLGNFFNSITFYKNTDTNWLKEYTHIKKYVFYGIFLIYRKCM